MNRDPLIAPCRRTCRPSRPPAESQLRFGCIHNSSPIHALVYPYIHVSFHPCIGVAGAFTFLFFSVSAEPTNSIPGNNSSDANLVAACVCPAGNSAQRSGGQANINIRHTPIHPCINNQYILVVYTYVMYPIYVIDISP